MSHITLEKLTRLVKLCRLELSVEDKKILLPQFENIISFVGKLQTCDTSDIENSEGFFKTPLREGVFVEFKSLWYFENVEHPVIHQAIEINNKLIDGRLKKTL